MADLSKQKEQMWLSAIREIGLHFSKIGGIITRCAEDTENLTRGDVDSGRGYSSLQKSGSERASREDHRVPLKRKSVDDPIRGAAPSYKPMDPVRRYPNPDVDRGSGGPSSYNRSRYGSLQKDPRREYPHPDSRNGRVARGHRGDDEEDEDDDEMLSERFRGRKRTAPMSSPSAGGRQQDDRQRKDSDHYPLSRSRVSRPMKRVRMNWTEAENATFFDTVRRFATDDDNAVLHKIVAALNGARTLIQCKGHFRNMLVVGKVIQSETEPRRWIVVDDPVEQKRTSIGGKSLHMDLKNSRSSGVSKDDAGSGNRNRDEVGDEQLKGLKGDDKTQGSHQDDKPIDDEDDVVLDDIEDDDERDKDYQDEEGMDDDDGDDDENESGTNNTAVRVTDVGEIDPGSTAAAVFENPGIGNSVRDIDDGPGKGMPLKKQPGGRVGDVTGAQSLHGGKPDMH